MNTLDSQALLVKAPADGSTVGNQSLRKALGWTVKRKDATRDREIEDENLDKGRFRKDDAQTPNRCACSFSP